MCFCHDFAQLSRSMVMSKQQKKGMIRAMQASIACRHGSSFFGAEG